VVTRRLVVLCALTALLAAGAPRARGQTSLGGQRAGTSSGTFLKIGVDARGVALGGAYVALVEGPFAPFYNPAGISKMRHPEAAFSYARWPADIGIYAFSFGRPWGDAGAALAVSAEYVGTSLDETDEYHPLGTGRTFSYSDLLLGFSAARPFTDRLSIGISAKFFREDLGSGVGGPVTQSWLVDAGTSYLIGTLNGRLAIGLLNFGPDLKPEGTFYSSIRRDQVDYASFSAPTSFRIGLSMEPYRRGAHALLASTEVVHVADNQESFRGGLEYSYQGRYFVRTGMDPSADAMKFSAGLGLSLPFAGSNLKIDYAYTDGGPLLAIHRWSVVLPF
jgi:hypothetical protein